MRWLAILIFAALSSSAFAQSVLPSVTVAPGPGGSQTYTLTIQTLLFLTSLTFLPAVLLMMTSFTRIIIVLSLLRQALGAVQAPPNQVLVGLSLFLTFFVMSPVLDKIYSEAYKPLSENRITMEDALDKGAAPANAMLTPAAPHPYSAQDRRMSVIVLPFEHTSGDSTQDGLALKSLAI